MKIGNSSISEIRPGTREDTEEIIRLLRVCLLQTAGIPRTPEFWNWKHFQNPFGPSPFLVCTHKQTIVGLRAFLRWHWRSNLKALPAVRAVDTATHPDWQGKGIFSHLTTTLLVTLRQDGDCFVFNTPNSASLPGYLKMGWSVVTKIPLWIRPLRPLSIVWKLAFAKSKTTIQNDHYLWPEDAPLEESLKIINERNHDEKRLHTLRTAAFLKWRYQKIPGLKYQARIQTKSGDSALLISRERERKGMKEMSISELLLTPGDAGIRLAVDAMQEMISGTTADYALAVAAHETPEETVLKKCGFYRAGKRGPVLTFLKLNDCVPQMNFLDWSNWRCSIGDLEIF